MLTGPPPKFHGTRDILHFGLQRFRYGRRIDPVWNRSRGHKAHHRRALREAAQHHLGLGTVPRHGNDMGARVSNTVGAGGPLIGGGVIDRIDLE